MAGLQPFIGRRQQKAENKRQKANFNANYLRKGSPEEAMELSKLSDTLLNADVKASQYFANLEEWERIHGDDPEGIETAVDHMNRRHAKAMMMYCMAPLRNGASQGAVSRTVGNTMICYMFSKDFRRECHESVQNLMYPYVKANAEKAGPDSFWAKTRDKILMEQNNGRLPLNPRSAAVMQIGLMQRAYTDMRKPGADIDAVFDDYAKRSGKLRSMANKDGIGDDLFNQNVRTMVGKFVEKNPNYKMFFQQTAEDGIKKSEARPMQVGDETRYAWRGEFETADGKPYHNAFSPRMPSDASSHVTEARKDMDEAMSRCKSWSDVMGMYDAQSGCVKASFDKDMHERMSFRKMMNEQDSCDQRDFESRSQAWSDGWKASMDDWLKSHPEARQDANKFMGRQTDVTERGYPSGGEIAMQHQQLQQSDSVEFE